MPLSGAIVLGELDVVDDVADPSDWIVHVGGLVGLGLVEAYELERLVDWAGVVLDGPVAWSWAKHVREHISGDPAAEAAITGNEPFLVEALPPFKDSGKPERA
jgi:hypothetical protein